MSEGRFGYFVFPSHGITPLGYAAFGFALGVTGPLHPPRHPRHGRHPGHLRCRPGRHAAVDEIAQLKLLISQIERTGTSSHQAQPSRTGDEGGAASG